MPEVPRPRAARRPLTLLSAALVAGLLALPLTSGPATAGDKIADTYFGMHDSTMLARGRATGSVGAVRLWDTGTTWRNIETSAGVYDWRRLDQYVAAADAGRDRPLLVLGQTPAFWAADPASPGYTGAGAASPPDLAAWKRYVTATSKRYGNSIDYQLWNEPNVKGFWLGTPAQMAELSKIAAAIIHRQAPKSKVVGPSFPLRLKSQQRWYTKYWSVKWGSGKRAKTLADYVDIAALSGYPLATAEPEDAMALIRFAGSTVKERAGKRLPVWDTELNFGAVDWSQTLVVDPQLQAAYVVRAYLTQAAAGASRVYWYRWDLTRGASTMLTDSSGAVTPAGTAFGVVRGWMSNATFKGCSVNKKRMYTCTLTTRTQIRRVYWVPGSKTLSVTAPKGANRLVGQTGASRTVKKGQRIKVTAHPVMVSAKR